MINKDKVKGFLVGIVATSVLCGTAFAAPIMKNVSIAYDSIKIYVDDKLVDLKGADGNKIEPFILNGTTYLPVRGISQALGKDISWDGNTKSIYIGKKSDIKPEEVTVSNANELYAALGSNKHIKLSPGVYNLSKLSQQYTDSKNVYWESVYDGNGLVLNNVSNLTFEGLGDKPVEIVVEPRYADVLTFIKCNNISLKNIKAGHTIDKGQCVGGVLNFDSSSVISIKDSLFYGCGTYGITANNTENLTFDNSIIEECTYGIMQLNGCKNFAFTNSKFRNCEGFDMIGVSSSNNIVFDKCEMTGNKSSATDFFNISLSKDIKFINSNYKFNEVNEFINDPSLIDITNTTFE